MAFRIAILAGVLVALLLVTEARRFDFLPSDDDENCHYVGKCSKDTAGEEYCMKKCSKNGYSSAGAFCNAVITPICCCSNGQKNATNSSDDDQYCYNMGTCTDRKDCMKKCEYNGFYNGARCIPAVLKYACCCLKDENIAPHNIP